MQCVRQSIDDKQISHNDSDVNKLSKAGWSWGCVSAIDSNGQTTWIAGAHRGGKRFVVRADEKLTAFVDLEAIRRPRPLH